MDAFGTVTILEIQNRKKIRNIGIKNENENMKHDKEITEYFENRGWTVIRIRECELKNINRQIVYEKLKIVTIIINIVSKYFIQFYDWVGEVIKCRHK